ncbi:MAG TPA: chromosome segregation protein SMC [Terriglobales bacterium]|nr:chromosome segregation protein SMC [Terriglobales bacterium]
MLKLKKLQILGFKSFCDRTELKFHGEGVAGIIGPNGCGKSNIADAIAWVLGEQSAKTLRGSRMEDVIFAGTRDRKPTGMAEVSLTMIDPEAYEGAQVAEPEIEIHNEMPADWDEAQLRTKSEQETDEYIEEVRPGQTEEVPGEIKSAAEDSNVTAEGNPSTSLGPGEATVGGTGEATTASEDSQARTSADGTNHPAVVLKIRRRKFNRTTFKKGEIVVTRRLFRSGESEYLLNGKLCRLRDIQDIFMGTGLGPESYAIIEQGRIGQILSSKPTDRRAIIEEAAGITKFKTKKRLAEARLEEAKLNLSRLNDIFDEVTRQMNSLKRQAAKAERFAKLREEMRAKLRIVLASKWTALQDERAEIETLLSQLAEEIRGKSEQVQTLEAEVAEKTQRGYTIENEARETRERLSNITRENDRLFSRQRNNEERCAELAARVAASSQEISAAEERLAALQQECEANRQTLENAAAEVAAAQEQARFRQEEARAATANLTEVERQQEQRRVQVMQAVAEESSLRSEIAKATEQIAGYERESSRLAMELTAANTQVEAFGAQRGQIAFEFESASGQVTAFQALIENTRRTLAEKRQAEIQSRQRLDGLRAEFATMLGKKASLEAVIAEHGYSTDSVRRLFQSGAMNATSTPAGVLADFLEVEDRYEHVVDDFLRDELNYVVVKSWDAAENGLQLLRTDVEGRATFLVHPEDAQAKFSFVPGEPNTSESMRRDAVVPLKQCIRVLDGFGKSLEVILPKLRDGYIVEDPKVARDLALENPDAFFLASSGECFHNVTVTGGKQRAEGPLAMKRELRDIARQVSDLENTLREEEHRAALLTKEIGELTATLERLESDKRDADRQAMTSGHSLKQLDSEMGRTRERLATYERELQQVAFARTAKESFIAERRQVLVSCEMRRDELEHSIAEAQESLANLRATRDAAAQASSEMMAQVAALEERRRGAAGSLQRIESMLTEVSVRIEALGAQSESALAESQQRAAENIQIAEQITALIAEREQLEVRIAELQGESEMVRARIAEIEEGLKSERQLLDQARDRRGELGAQAGKLESDSVHMAESSVAELGLRPEELVADETLQVITGEELALQDEEYRQMRARLEAIGPVNMMALEEYKETAERHEFLNTQRKDLLDSIENTQKTIKEIETVSRQKFEEAFAAINTNFTATFTKLFGGGTAFMRLTDEENAYESGIDVVASPPGKKLQNVLLLSGGEKALTALSLLVGIFQFAPSPFCILDEVDAPLDEANIGRFTQLVREMSTGTQFIIITHSKKTMSIAPALYGVTMQEPGVSKLVSVRFNEVESQPSAMSA